MDSRTKAKQQAYNMAGGGGSNTSRIPRRHCAEDFSKLEAQPDSTETLWKRLKSKKDIRQHPSYTVESSTELHPLVEAGHHNRTQSCLHRLPGHVLIKLFQTMDICSVECLRRVSQKFAYLCDGAALGHIHALDKR